MAPFTHRRKIWRPILVAVLITAGLATAVTAADAATTSKKTGICNKAKNYMAYLEYPGRGGMMSPIIYPGQCTSFALGGSGTEVVKVYGYLGSTRRHYYIGTRTVNPAAHNVFRTYGSLPGKASFTLSH